MTDQLLYDVDDQIATITFNRPDRMNTITHAMLEGFSELLLKADRDRNVRAIIVTGAGKAWCAGLDMAAAQAGDAFESDRIHNGQSVSLGDSLAGFTLRG